MTEIEQDGIGERPNSCKIGINAKGQWSGEVKSYGITLEEAMQETLKRAIELERIIGEKNQGK